jgi:hypothetical protein
MSATSQQASARQQRGAKVAEVDIARRSPGDLADAYSQPGVRSLDGADVRLAARPPSLDFRPRPKDALERWAPAALRLSAVSSSSSSRGEPRQNSVGPSPSTSSTARSANDASKPRSCRSIASAVHAAHGRPGCSSPLPIEPGASNAPPPSDRRCRARTQPCRPAPVAARSSRPAAAQCRPQSRSGRRPRPPPPRARHPAPARWRRYRRARQVAWRRRDMLVSHRERCHRAAIAAPQPAVDWLTRRMVLSSKRRTVALRARSSSLPGVSGTPALTPARRAEAERSAATRDLASGLVRSRREATAERCCYAGPVRPSAPDARAAVRLRTRSKTAALKRASPIGP